MISQMDIEIKISDDGFQAKDRLIDIPYKGPSENRTNYIFKHYNKCSMNWLLEWLKAHFPTRPKW